MYKRETIQSPLHKQSLQIKLFIKKAFHCYIMNQLFKKKRLKILRYDNEKQTKHPICHIMSFYDCMWHYGRKKKMEEKWKWKWPCHDAFKTRTACEKKGPALYIDTYMKAGASVWQICSSGVELGCGWFVAGFLIFVLAQTSPSSLARTLKS